MCAAFGVPHCDHWPVEEFGRVREMGSSRSERFGVLERSLRVMGLLDVGVMGWIARVVPLTAWKCSSVCASVLVPKFLALSVMCCENGMG